MNHFLAGVVILDGAPMEVSAFARLLALKDHNPDLRLMISVGGWTRSNRFSDMAADAAMRESFAIGDRVHVRMDSVPGHMRMPGYIRRKTGVVVGISPAYSFPDAHAHGEPALVHVGVFESYLQRGDRKAARPKSRHPL